MGDWLLILLGREPGKKQKKKQSILGDWFSILSGRELGKKQKKRKPTLGNSLNFNAAGRDQGKK